MDKAGNYVLSIAGFDPSGGAGLLADIKTFEAHKVFGMGAISAITFQNDIEFESVRWIDASEIVKQVSVLKRRFEFSAIKIGLIQNLETLQTILTDCHKVTGSCPVIWDPVIKASAGFEFHRNFEQKELIQLLRHIFLITPNIDEVKFLTGSNDPMKGAKELSTHCNALLKGGHHREEPGTDYLFTGDTIQKILPEVHDVSPKHGSGCVLSSSIAANLALGNDLNTSCRNAKKYVEHFLSSHQSLLGIHV